MSTAPRHILIVDDDADIRSAVALLLQSDGHVVVETCDGQHALNALSSSAPFDLIVLDLAMPVMNGLTFLARKAEGAHAAVPVVVFSSTLSPGLERMAGVVSVVDKLAGIDPLFTAVRDASASGARLISSGGLLA